ncbi:MAG: SDR family oxidoreductase [Acidimicrobiales bacterium]
MSLSSNDTALVTGASSGIGAATVRALRERGVVVHAAARRADRLAALAQDTGCVAQTLDVRDREAVAALCDEFRFDIVVNNAGLGRGMGSLWTADLDDIERTIDTNLTSVIHLLRAVLPGMVERGKGHIVNMSSVLALYAGPAALYGATKGAMHKLSQDLRHELQGTGIRVSEINPGRVDTEFYDVAYDDPARRAEVTNTGCEVIASADVADAVVYVLDAPWRVNVGLLEIMPTEQTYGGAQFVPVKDRRTQ